MISIYFLVKNQIISEFDRLFYRKWRTEQNKIHSSTPIKKNLNLTTNQHLFYIIVHMKLIQVAVLGYSTNILIITQNWWYAEELCPLDVRGCNWCVLSRSYRFYYSCFYVAKGNLHMNIMKCHGNNIQDRTKFRQESVVDDNVFDGTIIVWRLQRPVNMEQSSMKKVHRYAMNFINTLRTRQTRILNYILSQIQMWGFTSKE